MSFDNFERDLGMGNSVHFDPISKFGSEARLCHGLFSAIGNAIWGEVRDLGDIHHEVKPVTDADRAAWQARLDSHPGMSAAQILDKEVGQYDDLERG